MKEVYAGLAARDSAQRASRRMRDSLELDKPLPPSDSANVTPPAGPEKPSELENTGPEQQELTEPAATETEETTAVEPEPEETEAGQAEAEETEPE